MTPIETGDRTVDRLMTSVRARFIGRTLLRSGACAVAIGCVLGALLLWLDAIVGLSPTLRGTVRWIPLGVVLGALVPVISAWRAATPTRITRLIDERSGLGNILSTYRAPNAEGPVADAFRGRALTALRSVEPGTIVHMDAGRLWGWAAGAVLLALLSVVGTSGSIGTPAAVAPDREGARTPGAAPEAALPTLGGISVSVRPPGYTGLPTVEAEATTLSALPGSVVRITGGGSASGNTLRARVAGGGDLSARSAAEGWVVEWTVDSEHRGVSIEAVTAEEVVEQRVLPLRLLDDRPPRVTLTAPEVDLVLASPTGSIPVRARALDDYAVNELTLHWVHTRGGGESFDFVEGAWAWDTERPVPGGREAEFTIPLDELDLLPGDVIHIRATAEDANDVTGPGLGVSVTRQIRISNEDDLSDVTTLIGFPIEREREPLLSQRMIILLTEELRDTAQNLDREARFAEAVEIADEQARLRARIGEQIFSRATGAFQDPEAHLDFEIAHGTDGEDEHDHTDPNHVHVVRSFLDELEATVAQGPAIDPETGIATIADVEIMAHDHDSDPIIAINRSLLTIYNYMWDAERALRAAELDPSLVPQYLALDLLQELRDSERVFPRGRVAVPPIDVPAVRGTGEVDDAAPGARTPGASADPVSERVVEEIDQLLGAERIATGRVAAVRISGLALDLLDGGGDPGPSESLVRAAGAAEAGDREGVRAGLAAALARLRGSTVRISDAAPTQPTSLAAARYLAIRAEEDSLTPPRGADSDTADGGPAPFVFATVRYTSGNWDSAPLVPTNLIHSLAQYTDLPVEPEGVVVDLASEDVFDYPFLFLTGHLPVFFDEAESRNLVAFVERGGFVFIDDHNHDIDGAFHRSVTSELARLFGPERLTPVPNDHELYSSFFSFPEGPPITGHELSGWGDGLIHRELFQIEVDGRIGVLYSNKDYSSEWSYHAVNKRFLAIDNTRFGVNILVYALTR